MENPNLQHSLTISFSSNTVPYNCFIYQMSFPTSLYGSSMVNKSSIRRRFIAIQKQKKRADLQRSGRDT